MGYIQICRWKRWNTISHAVRASQVYRVVGKTRPIPEPSIERVISGEFGVTLGPYNVSSNASELYWVISRYGSFQIGSMPDPTTRYRLASWVDKQPITVITVSDTWTTRSYRGRISGVWWRMQRSIEAGSIMTRLRPCIGGDDKLWFEMAIRAQPSDN
jgi:hypothetical protein